MYADRFWAYVCLGILSASIAAAYHFAGLLLSLMAHGVRWLASRVRRVAERK